MLFIKDIIVHCSDSFFGNAALITLWHKKRGWRTIGYHFVVQNGYPTVRNRSNATYWNFLDGQIEIGRPLDNNPILDIDEIGAHCYGFNRTSVAICMIGKKSFSERVINSSIVICQTLMEHFNIDKSMVRGHYEFDGKKTCPNIDMNWFRKRL